MPIFNCWTCDDEGFVVKQTPHGKTVVPCPSCENRRLIREHKERIRQNKRRINEYATDEYASDPLS